MNIQELFHRYMQGTATPEEHQALQHWLLQHPDDAQALELLQTEWENLQEPDPQFAGYDVNASWRRIVGPSRVVHMRWMWAAAAGLLLLFAAGYYGLREKQAPPAQIAPAAVILPGKAGAVLTLSNGLQVSLDSQATGIVAREQGADAVWKNGALAYNTTNKTTAASSYNTVTTPRGRQFKMVLPDQTAVWLNAGSSIHYPTAFNGKERRVDISGEVYFEVAKMADKPFVVNAADKSTIEVLGTAFNINSYTDEKALTVTLVSGAVQVDHVLLKPGQQAIAGNGVHISNKTDIDKVLAWKNGVFNFAGADLAGVLRQISRWYDVEIVYETTKIPAFTFYGTLGRDLSLNQLINILKDTGVHFRIEGRKLIVMP